MLCEGAIVKFFLGPLAAWRAIPFQSNAIESCQFDAVIAPPASAMLGLALCVLSQCPLSSKVSRDPHLVFAHGGRADFRGRDGQYYNFLSAPGFAVNVR